MSGWGPQWYRALSSHVWRGHYRVKLAPSYFMIIKTVDPRKLQRYMKDTVSFKAGSYTKLDLNDEWVQVLYRCTTSRRHYFVDLARSENLVESKLGQSKGFVLPANSGTDVARSFPLVCLKGGGERETVFDSERPNISIKCVYVYFRGGYKRYKGSWVWCFFLLRNNELVRFGLWIHPSVNF